MFANKNLTFISQKPVINTCVVNNPDGNGSAKISDLDNSTHHQLDGVWDGYVQGPNEQRLAFV